MEKDLVKDTDMAVISAPEDRGRHGKEGRLYAMGLAITVVAFAALIPLYSVLAGKDVGSSFGYMLRLCGVSGFGTAGLYTVLYPLLLTLAAIPLGHLSVRLLRGRSVYVRGILAGVVLAAATAITLVLQAYQPALMIHFLIDGSFWGMIGLWGLAFLGTCSVMSGFLLLADLLKAHRAVQLLLYFISCFAALFFCLDMAGRISLIWGYPSDDYSAHTLVEHAEDLKIPLQNSMGPVVQLVFCLFLAFALSLVGYGLRRLLERRGRKG